MEWLAVFLAGGLAVISPGPDFVVTLRNSLSYSRIDGIYTAAGLATGGLVHTAYCLVGIGLVISQSTLLFTLIKWLGALYLIFLGIKSLKSKKRSNVLDDKILTKNRCLMKAYLNGFLTNILNPKATLFFLALFTQVVDLTTPLIVQIIYGMTVVLTIFCWFTLVSIFITQKVIQKRFFSFAHWIDRFTGIVLITLGIRIVLTEN